MHTRSLSGHAASEPNPFPNQPPAPTAGWLFAQAIQGRPVTDDSIRAAGFSTQSDRRGNAPQRSESWYIAQRLLGKPIPAEPRVERGPSQSWLIAQQLLGKPVLAPDPALAAQAAEECRKYREFVAAITGVNESIAWDPGKHPRGHFSQNRGWFSPKGTGGSTGPGASDSTGAAASGKAPSQVGGTTPNWRSSVADNASGAGGGQGSMFLAANPPRRTGSKAPATQRASTPPRKATPTPAASVDLGDPSDPSRWYLPSDAKGTWVGERGKSAFRLKEPMRINGKLVKEIKFIDGTPVLDHLALPGKTATIILTGNPDVDRANARITWQKLNPGKRLPGNAVFHHDLLNVTEEIIPVNGKMTKVLVGKMQLLPVDAHQLVFHEGSASAARKFYQGLNIDRWP